MNFLIFYWMNFLLNKLPNKIERRDLFVGFIIFLISISIIATIIINSVFAYTIKPEITNFKKTFNNITFNIINSGNGPDILCLHGLGEGNIAYNDIIRLLNSEFRLTIPDQRGYNLTDKPPEVDDYYIDYLIQDIDNFVNYIRNMNGNNPVVLIGHDFGGLLSIIYSNVYPTKVKSLILINSPHVRYIYLFLAKCNSIFMEK